MRKTLCIFVIGRARQATYRPGVQIGKTFVENEIFKYESHSLEIVQVRSDLYRLGWKPAV